MCLSIVLGNVNKQTISPYTDTRKLKEWAKIGVKLPTSAFNGRFKLSVTGIDYYVNSIYYPNVIRTGYKIFGHRIASLFQSGSYKRNKWYESNISLIQADDLNQYISGFHVFNRLDDARKYYGKQILSEQFKIYKVAYKDVTTLGFDAYDTEVIIARKMKILGTVKHKPYTWKYESSL